MTVLEGGVKLSNLQITNQNGQAVVSSRQVAENFGKRHDDVLKAIGVVLEGLPQNCGDLQMFYKSTYEHPQNKQIYPEYLMNRDGFTLLAMGFTGSDAMQWKLKYIQAFNEMEKQLHAPSQMSQLEMIAAMAQAAVANEKRLKEIGSTVTLIKDTIVQRHDNWRDNINQLINQAAKATGGNYQAIRAESYSILEERAACDLGTRLRNLKQRMQNEGATKTKIGSMTKMDVIEADSRLREIYTSIVKEMVIKYVA